MTQEDKKLLLIDLCARIPYGVKVCAGEDLAMTLKQIDYKCFCEAWENEDFKCHSRWMFPYLRPISSMTEEEKDELHDWGWEYTGNDIITGGSTDADNFYKRYEKNLYDLKWLADWLNAHHFDYRGLIEKGLALEALEGMYK